MPTPRRPRVSVAVAASVGLAATTAHANGRYPEANQLVVDRGGDPARLVLRTTYGLVQSTDAGKTWRWICEDAIGYSGEWDAPIGIAGDATILAGTPSGISVG